MGFLALLFRNGSFGLSSGLDCAVKGKGCIADVGECSQLVAHNFGSIVEVDIGSIQCPDVVTLVATASSIDVCQPASRTTPQCCVATCLVGASVLDHRLTGIEPWQPGSIIAAPLAGDCAFEGEALAAKDTPD